jgi:hypothetical protein
LIEGQGAYPDVNAAAVHIGILQTRKEGEKMRRGREEEERGTAKEKEEK